METVIKEHLYENRNMSRKLPLLLFFSLLLLLGSPAYALYRGIETGEHPDTSIIIAGISKGVFVPNAHVLLNGKEIKPVSEYSPECRVLKKDLKQKKNTFLITASQYRSVKLDIDSIFNSRKDIITFYALMEMRHVKDSVYYIDNREFFYTNAPSKLLLIGDCDTSRVKKVVDSLDLKIEKSFKYCTTKELSSHCPTDTYIITKKDTAAFSRKNSNELAMLRKAFPNGNIGPLMLQASGYASLTNSLYIQFLDSVSEARIKEILAEHKLKNLYPIREHYNLLLVEAGDEVGESIIDIARRLMTYKEILFVSNVLNMMDCPT
jgi:hypothetical protein